MRFKFRSLTHRLVFSCIVAALGIYSVSYFAANRLIREALQGWMTKITQSRLNAAATEIEQTLRAIEKEAQLVSEVNQSASSSPERTLMLESLLQALAEQQTRISAVGIAPISAKSRLPESIGFRQVRQREKLRKSQLTYLQARCQETIPNLTGGDWTTPYPLSQSQQKLGVTYCLPLADSAELLMIEIELEWLEPFLAQLPVTDEGSQLTLGEPLVFVPNSQQWIITPSEKIQSWSWFAPEPMPLPTPSEANMDKFESQLRIAQQAAVNEQGMLVFSVVPATDWILGIAFPETQIRLFQRRNVWIVVSLMVRDLLLICLAVALITHRTIRPLRLLIKSTDEIAHGNLDTQLPATQSRDEVGRLTQSFGEMRDALKDRIAELETTIAAKQKLESELAIAGQIQQTMVPQVDLGLNADSRYQISALLTPAEFVGGDLYDFFPLGRDRICFLIGDVVGKGIAASLLMARTVTLIRSIALVDSHAHEILEIVNDHLSRNNPECLFVSLFCGIVSLPSGELCYASAGHDAPILLDRHGKVGTIPLETGPPVGLYLDAEYPAQGLKLESDDLLLLYTDGITEATNAAGDYFSEERLLSALQVEPPGTPIRTIRILQFYLHQFVENHPQSDDITLLAFQYAPTLHLPLEEKTVEWQITINTELTQLDHFRQHLGEILLKEQLSSDYIEDAQLVSEEILANIISYGHEPEITHTIDIWVRLAAGDLSLRFEDAGQPFNPLQEIDTPDFALDFDERPIGGLGFHLVKELSDHIDYIYRDRKNILTVSRRIAGQN
ncbi:MAG: SpoIIE family protein phosphatase [Cyanobacteria bacterium P01_H01_bin.15]